jgi:hypothetical protein
MTLGLLDSEPAPLRPPGKVSLDVAMNCSSPRSIALALLLTLHGIAILCGPAIHRRERHAWPSRARAGTGWAALPTQVGPSHADCSLCHFLSQGQLGTRRAEIVSYENGFFGYLSLESRDIAIILVHDSRPRAPPQI